MYTAKIQIKRLKFDTKIRSTNQILANDNYFVTLWITNGLL